MCRVQTAFSRLNSALAAEGRKKEQQLIYSFASSTRGSQTTAVLSNSINTVTLSVWASYSIVQLEEDTGYTTLATVMFNRLRDALSFCFPCFD